MKFRYRARTKSGELQVGFVEAPTKEAGINILTGHELYLLSIVEAERKGVEAQVFNFFNRVKTRDLMVFTRQFATLLSARVPLGDGLKTLANQTENPILVETIINIHDDVSSGLSLSQSLSRYGNVFSPFYVNMIQSGEVTGRVDEVMNFLADFLEKDVSLTGKIKNALIYPAIMIALFAVVGVVMGTMVLPQIGTIFAQAGAQLPFITAWLISGGQFVSHWWWMILIVFSVVFVFLADYLKSPEGKVVYDEFLLRLPVFSGLFKEMYVARITESLSVLIKGGVPITEAIEVTGRTMGSLVYEEILQKIADSIRKGELLNQAINHYPDYFPPLVSQMVAVGESTGKLEELLSKVADFYSREVDDVVSNLVELIQPILMVIIGGLIGLLFVSILTPIYNLVTVINSQ
ncbi:MAG TPA: type II secretion system F family protein [Candidatus Tyrphobacter sp.]|nr:type II secretion system F family protein [Candidatus Tyrphobacter sp.]